MAKKVRFRRQLRRSSRDELLEILSQPRGDEDARNRRQLAWKKQERLRFGRIYRDDDAYIASLEEKTGVALEDAPDEWLTTCFGEPAPKF